MSFWAVQLKNSAIYFSILIAYFLFRFFGNLAPLNYVYIPILQPQSILNSYRWYISWSIGVPEMFLDFVGPGLSINPNLFKYFLIPTVVISSLFLLLGLFLFISLIFLLAKNNLIKDYVFWFGICWFLITILL